MKSEIKTAKAPQAIGPYSQAIKAGDFLFVSGQLPIDPATNAFAGNDIKSQTRQSLKNIDAVLQEAGATMDDVVKANVFMKDMGDFGAMNEVYAEFFHGVCPARAAVQVAALPKDALVEIEVIAAL